MTVRAVFVTIKMGNKREMAFKTKGRREIVIKSNLKGFDLFHSVIYPGRIC
jgi:hypothetical protein